MPSRDISPGHRKRLREKFINLKLSNITTNYCPELHQRLVELVGEEGLRLEPTGNA